MSKKNEELRAWDVIVHAHVVGPQTITIRYRVFARDRDQAIFYAGQEFKRLVQEQILTSDFSIVDRGVRF